MATAHNKSNTSSHHHNSSASVNLKDKITSKIRDCLSSVHHASELCLSANPSSLTINETVRNGEPLDDTIDEAASTEWHTPCDTPNNENFDYRNITSPPAGGPRVYRALFPYKATRNDEVSFEPGDVVVLLHHTSERGWWYGEHQPTGKTGLFPANYVEAFTKSAQKNQEGKNRKKSSTVSNSSENTAPLRPGRLTAIESELAALKSKVEAKPSKEQLKILEEEVDRLKIVTSAVNSPNLLSGVNSPLLFCRETPLMNYAAKQTSVPESFAGPEKAALDKQATQAIPFQQPKTNSATKPGQIKVPACFQSTNQTPTGSVAMKKTTTPNPQNSSILSKPGSASYKSAGVNLTLSGRASTSPASTHVTAVRVQAVVTPTVPVVSMDGDDGDDEFADLSSISSRIRPNSRLTAVDRKASVKAAGKLKRRSIGHYTKKCQRNFSKLCSFYETLAESNRLGMTQSKMDCSSTSPSSLSSTRQLNLENEDNTAPLTIFDKSNSIFVSQPAAVNKSLDNPFNQTNRSVELLASKNSPKRFPAFNHPPVKTAQQATIAQVLLKQQDQIRKMPSNLPQQKDSPSLKNIRVPPKNKQKVGPVLTQQSTLSTPQPIMINNKARYPRCSSAQACGDSKTNGNEVVDVSVNDLRRRFESISVSGATGVVTNALNSQPREKRSRKCLGGSDSAGPSTPKSAGRTKKISRITPPEDLSGKDSGLGNYPPKLTRPSIDSTAADVFNNAQTTQMLDCDFMDASRRQSNQNITLKPSQLKDANDQIRCSSASMMNEAGIFDCSLTWTESSSSDSAGDHHERHAALFQALKPVIGKTSAKDDFVRV